MKNIVTIIVLVFAFTFTAQAQKKGKGKKPSVDKILTKMTKELNFQEKLDNKRKLRLISELSRLKDTDGLSNDTLEIVTKNLG